MNFERNEDQKLFQAFLDNQDWSAAINCNCFSFETFSSNVRFSIENFTEKIQHLVTATVEIWKSREIIIISFVRIFRTITIYVQKSRWKTEKLIQFVSPLQIWSFQLRFKLRNRASHFVERKFLKNYIVSKLRAFFCTTGLSVASCTGQNQYFFKIFVLVESFRVRPMWMNWILSFWRKVSCHFKEIQYYLRSLEFPQCGEHGTISANSKSFWSKFVLFNPGELRKLKKTANQNLKRSFDFLQWQLIFKNEFWNFFDVPRKSK